MKIFLKCPKRSVDDLAQVPVSRSCGDPGEVLSKRPLHEDLEDALFFGGSCMKAPLNGPLGCSSEFLVSRSCKILSAISRLFLTIL